MGKLARVAGAYLVAGASTIGPALVGSALARAWFDVSISYWQAAGSLWLLAVGGPSVAWATNYLSRQLGVKTPVEVVVGGVRSVPIFGGSLLGDVVRLAVPRRQGAELQIPDGARGLVFRGDGLKIEEPELRWWLLGCWRRQRRGESPLARTYWVDGGRVERPVYELCCDLLVSHDLIRGERRQGSKNRLRYPPELTISELRFAYARAGWVPVPGTRGAYGRLGRLGRPG